MESGLGRLFGPEAPFDRGEPVDFAVPPISIDHAEQLLNERAAPMSMSSRLLHADQ